ncbi:MAG: AAA family ATPase, partial [Erysipelotrichaceae bacterium]|nr:AAA family ATPase [Erysipelotrichaceae bacterium]
SRLQTIFQSMSGLRCDSRGIGARVQKRTRMTYDSIQLQAIETALTSKILILTGGPGTGKTTTTLGIITALRESGASVLLAAPTACWNSSRRKAIRKMKKHPWKGMC